MQYVVEYMFLKETSTIVEADSVTQAKLIVEKNSPVPLRVYSVQAKPPTYPRLIVEDFGREWWIALGPEPDMFTDEIKVGPFRSEGSARIYWQRTANTPLQTAAQT